MSSKIRVGIMMGSQSDLPVMQAAADVLTELEIGCEMRIMSAHRTPEEADAFATSARDRGIEVLICGAGMAAHLAGCVAGRTLLPVIGVPLGASMGGMDSLLATVQMPGGIPVATFAIGKAGAKNAGLFAGQILAGRDARVRRKLEAYRKKQTAAVPETPF